MQNHAYGHSKMDKGEGFINYNKFDILELFDSVLWFYFSPLDLPLSPNHGRL